LAEVGVEVAKKQYLRDVSTLSIAVGDEVKEKVFDAVRVPFSKKLNWTDISWYVYSWLSLPSWVLICTQ
jgi:hypothetical protein